jgi:hypothetical protein
MRAQNFSLGVGSKIIIWTRCKDKSPLNRQLEMIEGGHFENRVLFLL